MAPTGKSNVRSRGPTVTLLAWSVVIGLHLVLTFIMTYPAALHFHTHLFNGALGDKLQYIWVFWWVKRSLVMTHESLLYTDLLYFPTGVSLALHDMTFFWSLLSAPLQSVLEPTTLLNLFLLIAFPLNGLAFYRLAYEVTRNPWGSVAGSVLFAYCPFLLGRFRVDHVGIVATFFIPLFLLELWRYSHRPAAVHLAKAGLYLALTALTTYYNGVLLLLILIVYLVHSVLTSRARSRFRVSWRELVKHLAIMSLMVAVILSPFVIPILVQLARGDYSRSTRSETYRGLEGSSGDLVAYLVPDYGIARWRGWAISERAQRRADALWTSLSGNRYEKATYPGWITWIGLVVALAYGPLRKRAWPWVVLALGAFVFTIGPTLHVNGQPFLRGLLPMRFWHLIPVFNIVRGVSRFAFLIPLGGGMLLALGVALLAENGRMWLSRSLSLVAVTLIVVEFLPVPTSVVPKNVWISPFYYRLHNESGDYAVLNVPVDFHGARGGAGLYGYVQLVHEKRIIGGYVAREPDYVFGPLENYAFLQAIAQREYEKDRGLRLGCPGLRDMHRTLNELNVRYVIVHKVFLGGGEWLRVNGWLRRGLAESVYEDEYIRVYRYGQGSNAPRSESIIGC